MTWRRNASPKEGIMMVDPWQLAWKIGSAALQVILAIAIVGTLAGLWWS